MLQKAALLGAYWSVLRDAPLRGLLRTRREDGRRLPGGEIPQRAPDAALRRVLESERVEIGEVAGRSVVRPAEADLDPAALIGHELLDRTGIVDRGDRRAEAANRPVLIAPDPAIGSGHAHQAGSFVIVDDQRPELALALIVAFSRHRLRPRRDGDGRTCDEGGESGGEETNVGHGGGNGSGSHFDRQLPCYHARNRLRSGLLGECGEIFTLRPANQKSKLTATAGWVAMAPQPAIKPPAAMLGPLLKRPIHVCIQPTRRALASASRRFCRLGG